jgi:hypothetical protein
MTPRIRLRSSRPLNQRPLSPPDLYFAIAGFTPG